MRVGVVMGTRPEIIKLAPVAWALAERQPQVEVRILLTGQHGTFAHELCAELDLPVDADLGGLQPQAARRPRRGRPAYG
mgnify:CR=1 FL=1